jgi:hypothetical protein
MACLPEFIPFSPLIPGLSTSISFACINIKSFPICPEMSKRLAIRFKKPSETAREYIIFYFPAGKKFRILNNRG